MSITRGETDRFLRFAVIGAPCSGHGVVRQAIDAHPRVVCHGDLLHENEQVRQAEYSYTLFDTHIAFLPFDQLYISAEQYLNRIFSVNGKNERAVGVKLSYDKIIRYDMWSYLDAKVREGDFCVIHVDRNPVSCYVRARRAAQDRSRDRYRHHALMIEPEDLVAYTREHIATYRKIEQVCEYRIKVNYAELRAKARLVADFVCPYLGLHPSGACYMWQKQPGPPLRRLVANWDMLKRAVDSQVGMLMEQAEWETTAVTKSEELCL